MFGNRFKRPANAIPFCRCVTRVMREYFRVIRKGAMRDYYEMIMSKRRECWTVNDT